MLELCLAVILIMAVNRFFRKRDAATPRDRGVIVRDGQWTMDLIGKITGRSAATKR